MKHLGTSIEIAAPVSTAWELLTEFEHWPDWGTSIRRVESAADRVAPGVTGRVQTILGLWLPFEISEVVPNHSWDWRVAGVPATGHFLAELGPGRCRVQFTVAWALAPYLVALRMSLGRLKRMAEQW